MTDNPPDNKSEFGAWVSDASKSVRNSVKKALDAIRSWVKRQPPGWGGAIGRIIVASIVVFAGLQFVEGILFSNGAQELADAYELVALAAVISTVVVAIMSLIDEPHPTRQPGHRRSSYDAGRFWLMCFALIVGAVIASGLIGRLPATIEPAWLTGERPVDECQTQEQEFLDPDKRNSPGSSRKLC